MSKAPSRAEIDAAKALIQSGQVGKGRPSLAMIAARAELAAPPKKKETAAERLARIVHRFNLMFDLAHGICLSAVRSLIISGAPGVGKSHTVMKVMESYADNGKIKFGHVTGSISAINLYMLMYNHRGKNDVLLIDDADDIFGDEAAFSILKAGLDTNEKRMISWMTETHILAAAGVDKQFEYEGQMIFITNYNFQEIVDKGKSRFAPSFAALMSRSVYLDLKLHDRLDVCTWMRYLVSKTQMLQNDGLSAKDETAAMDWLEQNMDNLREMSLRTAKKVAAFIKMHNTKGGDWKATASVLLCR